MGIPTWVPGEVLTSSDVNSWFVPQAAYFTAGTQTISSTGFTTVTGMSIASLPLGTYGMEAKVYWTPNQSAGSASFEFNTDTMTNSAFQGAWYEVAVGAAPGAGSAFGGNSGDLSGLAVSMQSSTMGTEDRMTVMWAEITVSLAGAFTLQAACTTGADTWTIKSGKLELQRHN